MECGEVRSLSSFYGYLINVNKINIHTLNYTGRVESRRSFSSLRMHKEKNQDAPADGADDYVYNEMH